MQCLPCSWLVLCRNDLPLPLLYLISSAIAFCYSNSQSWWTSKRTFLLISASIKGFQQQKLLCIKCSLCLNVFRSLMIYLVHDQHNKKYRASQNQIICSCVGWKNNINPDHYSNFHCHKNICTITFLSAWVVCGIYILYL